MFGSLARPSHHLSHYCWGEEDAIGDPFLEVFEGLRPSAWDSQGRLTMFVLHSLSMCP